MMKCKNCGCDIEKNWKFCPRCGLEIEKDRSPFAFGGLFKRLDEMVNEFADIDRDLDIDTPKDFEIFDLSPWFEKPKLDRSKMGGFSIRITQSNDKEPKISIKRFGETGKPTPSFQEMKKQKVLETRGKTEEPVTKVTRHVDKIVVEIELPGVKSEEDISVTELEESVEVKAITKDKTYFKILNLPGYSGLISKEFKNGVLRLEFSL